MHIYARGRHETIAAYMYNEITRPYAGIIRIRLLGRRTYLPLSLLYQAPQPLNYKIKTEGKPTLECLL